MTPEEQAAADAAAGTADKTTEDTATTDATYPAGNAVLVPADHVDLVERIVAALASGERWVVDNFHAAVSAVESKL